MRDHTILQAVVGSTAHGLALVGTDDRDEMGICLETFEQAVGFSPFEQHIFRTAEVREGRHDAPSQPGDLDLTVYSLKKFLRLALQGNPSVLNLLFVSDPIVRTPEGTALQALAPLFVSKQAGKRYLGYMESQRQRLLGERGQKRTNRPELEAAYGFDTKYAMHILRLGVQGVELLTTGQISLPLQEPQRTEIRAVREGQRDLNYVLQWAGDLERELKDLLTTADVPDEPARDRVESWMFNTYWTWWSQERTIP